MFHFTLAATSRHLVSRNLHTSLCRDNNSPPNNNPIHVGLYNNEENWHPHPDRVNCNIFYCFTRYGKIWVMYHKYCHTLKSNVAFWKVALCLREVRSVFTRRMSLPFAWWWFRRRLFTIVSYRANLFLIEKHVMIRTSNWPAQIDPRSNYTVPNLLVEIFETLTLKDGSIKFKFVAKIGYSPSINSVWSFCNN